MRSALARIALLAPVAASIGLSGCAREARPVRMAFGGAPGWVIPKSDLVPTPFYGEHPGSLPRAPEPVTPSPLRFAAAPGVPTYADGRPRPFSPAEVAQRFPAGASCQQELSRAGVAFQVLSERHGVQTPVAFDGRIGDVRYFSVLGGPMVADCRLGLALLSIAPELSALGITDVRYSGAYSYRMARPGRLSLHAHGLALDVHEVTAGGRSYSVARDFGRALENGCVTSAPLLNQLACRLARTRIFQELLTPDTNYDHRDHLHVAIAEDAR